MKVEQLTWSERSGWQHPATIADAQMVLAFGHRSIFEQSSFADDLASHWPAAHSRRLLDRRTNPRHRSARRRRGRDRGAVRSHRGARRRLAGHRRAQRRRRRAACAGAGRARSRARPDSFGRPRHQRRGARARARRDPAVERLGHGRPVGRRRALQGNAGAVRSRGAEEYGRGDRPVRFAAACRMRLARRMGSVRAGAPDHALEGQRVVRARRPVRARALQTLPRRTCRRPSGLGSALSAVAAHARSQRAGGAHDPFGQRGRSQPDVRGRRAGRRLCAADEGQLRSPDRRRRWRGTRQRGGARQPGRPCAPHQLCRPAHGAAATRRRRSRRRPRHRRAATRRSRGSTHTARSRRSRRRRAASCTTRP